MTRMQPPSTTYEPGDVVAIRFQFREESRPKPRPAVIVSVPQFHDSRLDAVMVAISTRTDREYFGDCVIQDWEEAGLGEECKSKGIIRTIEQSKIRDRLGRLSDADKARVQASLREILGL